MRRFWCCLAALLNTDELQVFELSNDQGVQKIINAQEQPPHQTEAVLLEVDPIVTARIYIIDDGDHTTMMLAARR